MTTKTKAHQTYKSANGEIVPSVTTVLNILSKPALINWAYNLGREGKDLGAERQKALDTGTLAHYFVQCDIKKEKPEAAYLAEFAPANVDKAENAYLAYLDWLKSTGLTITASEVRMVSQLFYYGGTVDAIAERPGECWLLDWKSSKAIYDEHIYQVCAYAQLWAENTGKPVSHVAIIKLGKEDGAFEVRQITNFGQYEKPFQIFWHCRQIYGLLKGG